MTERDGGSKKALLFALVLVAIVGGGAWFAFVRKSAAPATLLAAPITRAETKPGETSLPAAQPAAVAPPVSHPAGSAESANAVPASGSSATPDSSSHRQLAKQKSSVAHEPSATVDADLSAPNIPSSVDVDAVTRGIEQSTKAKVDSAAKPRIDVKPIFKKP